MVEKEKTETKKKAKTGAAAERYFWSVGRRKSAVATVKLYPARKGIIFNGKSLTDYFPVLDFQQIVQEPLRVTNQLGKVGVELVSRGGGVKGQAEAARLAVARALVKFNPEFKKALKVRGLLTRDARVKERKKPGLRKARRAHQWKKR